MNLASMFGGQQKKTLAQLACAAPKVVVKSGPFPVVWPERPIQQVKDYKVIKTEDELIAYLQRCEETGLCGFDYETSISREGEEIYERIRSEFIADETLDDATRTKNLEVARKAYLRYPLDPHLSDVCTISLSATAHESRVIFIENRGSNQFHGGRSTVFALLEERLFQNPKVTKIAVNLTFETKFTLKQGIYISNPVADPLVMWVRCLQLVKPQSIIDPKKPTTGKGLKPMTKEVFGIEMHDFTKLLEKYSVNFFGQIPSDNADALNYSAEDADYAVQHYLYWREIAKQIPRYDEWLHTIEMPFGRVIGQMEYHGMPWDDDLAETKKQEAQIALEEALNELKRIAKEQFGADIKPGKTGKTGSVKHFLFDVLKVPAAKWSKKTQDVSLDEEALIDMRFMLERNLESINEEDELGSGSIKEKIIESRDPHPHKETAIRVLDIVQKVQTTTTLLSSHIVGRQKYVNPVTGCIHASYSPWTETSRLLSEKPNGQNIPRIGNDAFGIRNFFTAPPGKILYFVDFSGFELRIMAWVSGDEVMIKAFNHGEDLHKKTASTMTGKPESEITKEERNSGKAGNFGCNYGGTEHALRTTIKKDYGIRKSLPECKAIVDAVMGTYPRILEYQQNVAMEAREQGYVEAIYGYKRLLPNINSFSNSDRRADERRAGNSKVQGGAAEIMKKCQNEVYDLIGKRIVRGDMIAQIHDEIVMLMPDDVNIVTKNDEIIREIMTRPPIEGFPVPVEVEASVGYRWGQKMSIEKWKETLK